MSLRGSVNVNASSYDIDDVIANEGLGIHGGFHSLKTRAQSTHPSIGTRIYHVYTVFALTMKKGRRPRCTCWSADNNRFRNGGIQPSGSLKIEEANDRVQRGGAWIRINQICGSTCEGSGGKNNTNVTGSIVHHDGVRTPLISMGQVHCVQK